MSHQHQSTYVLGRRLDNIQTTSAFPLPSIRILLQLRVSAIMLEPSVIGAGRDERLITMNRVGGQAR